MGHNRCHRNNRGLKCIILPLLHISTSSSWLLLLPLLPILPLRRVLRDILDLCRILGRSMAILPVEMAWFPPLLALPRRVVLHPQTTIRQRRDYERPVRPDDAGPRTAHPNHLEDTSLLEKCSVQTGHLLSFLVSV